jgi:ankyrin repeat protein
MTALMEAARAPEGFEIAKAIVEAGAAIDLFSKTGVTALSMAASGGNGPVIALLLQHKADVNALHEEGSTALMAAAEMISANNGSMSIIDALLSVGADVNVARCASGTRLGQRERRP